jgi:hypothetical protein
MGQGKKKRWLTHVFVAEMHENLYLTQRSLAVSLVLERGNLLDGYFRVGRVVHRRPARGKTKFSILEIRIQIKIYKKRLMVNTYTTIP